MDDLALLKNVNMLYVEDDTVVQEQYGNIFERFFNKVYFASNGLEALELFQTKEIALIATDLKMPVMDGFELAKEIRQSDDTTPIFIMSSYSDKEDLLKVIGLNLIDYIIKPASYSKIKKILQKSLKNLQKNSFFKIDIAPHICFYPHALTLECNEEKHLLQKKESMLLSLLIKNKDRLVTKEMIDRTLYDTEAMSVGTVKNIISHLRKIIGNDKICTVKNGGYIYKS